MKKPKFLKSRLNYLLILGTFLSVLFIANFSFYLIKNYSLKTTPANLQSLAENIVQKCKDVKYRPGCYEKEIPKLMDSPDSLTMSQAFDVTALVQEIDTEYGYCHLTGHNLAQKEVRKDPGNWKEVITKCPVAGCANGCVHGVFMEKFNAEKFDESQMNQLSRDVKTVCEKNELWNPTSSESSGCFHALGHAAMYLTDADIQRSTKFCYEVGNRNNNNTNNYFNCYQGLFMQIYQPLEAEDRSLVQKIKPTSKEQSAGLCSKSEGLAKIACFNQMWPMFFKDFQNPEKLTDYCKYYEPKYKNYCYSTAINILTSNLKLDVDFMLNYCSKLADPTPGWCLGQSASRMFEIDVKNETKVIDMCSKGANFDPGGECFQKLINMGNSVFRNPKTEKPQFCSHLPDDWKQQCLES